MDRNLASGPLVWFGIIVTTCLLLVVFQTVLWLVMPVLIAIVSYYLMSPLVSVAMTRGLDRSRAVFIVVVLLSLLGTLVGLSIAPKIAATFRALPDKLPEYVHEGSQLVANAGHTLHKYLPFLYKPAPLPTSVGVVGGGPATSPPEDDLTRQVSALTDKYSSDIVLELLHWVPSLLLVPYLTYFFLLDGPRFKRFLVRAIPNAFFEKTLYLFYRVEDQLRRYFQGLLALTALDALCLGVGLWFLGLNAPFTLAVAAAIFAWLPYLGSIAGCLLVVLVAAHDAPDNPWLPYETVGLFIAVRLLDDFVFLPLTVGRSLRMHPLVTVLMILLGGAVAGIAGLLLVMPVLGVVMVAGQIIGELVVDDRIIARHRHARELRRLRAQADL
jgi:predicted PurR-regulated permease PerM